jgi:hypothetical protein
MRRKVSVQITYNNKGHGMLTRYKILCNFFMLSMDPGMVQSYNKLGPFKSKNNDLACLLIEAALK